MNLKIKAGKFLDNFLIHLKNLTNKVSAKTRPIYKSNSFRKIRNISLVTGKLTGFFLLLYFIFVFVSPALQEYAIKFVKPEIKEYSVNEKALAKKLKELEKDNKLLERKLDQKMPQQPFFVVNSTENKFRLYKNKKVIREGVCSTGSYIMLKAADERKWIFQTPRGVFRIQGKTTSPVWIKPDWAFIEEGLPVPSARSNLRYEYGVLGDYALSLGHGYLIHGTLYQRFLGMPVTHGCIRLGDDDLKEVYKTLTISSKVYIY